MGRTTPRQREERREQLLAVATRIFASKGYHAASVADVIAAAGVARGTFYNYFPSKRELFGAVLSRQIAAMEGAAAPMRLDRPIDQQVRETVRAVLEAAHPDGALARLLFREAVGLDSEAAAQLRSFYGALLTRLEGALALGQAAGVVRPGATRMMGASIIGTVREWAFQHQLGNSLGSFDDCVEEFVTLLTRGVLQLSEPPDGTS